MIWFTADTHFGHEGVIKHQPTTRPYVSTEEMDEHLVEVWNAHVTERDEVWHLGDFAWHDPARYRARLRGRIHLVEGNHDRSRLVDGAGFVSVTDSRYLRYDGMRFWLTHYPHRAWPKSHKGSYHLYGHTHGAFPPYGRSMDVGVDSAYALFGMPRPIALEEIVFLLEDAEHIHHHRNPETGVLT